MTALDVAGPQWQPGMRRDFIGGSDLASILGLGNKRWGSPWKLWAQLVGLVELEVSEEQERRYRRGHIAERFIAELFHEETGLHIGATQLELTHPEWPFLVSHLDGLVYEHPVEPWAETDELEDLALAAFEAKSASGYGWDEVPLYYETQAVWNTGLARLNGIDVDRCVVGALHDRFTFRTYDIGFDPVGFDLMVAAAVEFWLEHVVTGVAPEVDGSEATTEALAAAYRTASEATVDIDDGLYERWVQLGADTKTAEEQFEQVRNELRAAIGEATFARCPNGHSFSWKPQGRRSVALSDLGPQLEHWLNEEGLINESVSRTLRHHNPPKPKKGKS